MRVFVGTVLVVCLVATVVGVLGYTRAHSAIHALEERVARVEQGMPPVVVASWEESTAESPLLPTQADATSWLATAGDVGPLLLARLRDPSLLDQIARGTQVTDTDLSLANAEKLALWLHLRARRTPDEECLRRYVELVRFREAYAFVADEVRYAPVSYSISSCADAAGPAERERAANILDDLALLQPHHNALREIDALRERLEQLRERVRPWSMVDSEYESDSVHVDTRVELLEAWLRSPQPDPRVKPWADAVRGGAVGGDATAPAIALEDGRPLPLEPRARIADEAARQAEQLLMRALSESDLSDEP